VCVKMFSSIMKARIYINCLQVSPLGGDKDLAPWGNESCPTGTYSLS